RHHSVPLHWGGPDRLLALSFVSAPAPVGAVALAPLAAHSRLPAPMCRSARPRRRHFGAPLGETARHQSWTWAPPKDPSQKGHSAAEWAQWCTGFRLPAGSDCDFWGSSSAPVTARLLRRDAETPAPRRATP